jgi:hypothetical protein
MFLTWVYRIRRGLLKPLTVSQMLSSAAGAGGMIIAASKMSPVEFTRFALFALIGSIILGLNVAGLLQPALINQRLRSDSLVPFRYVLITLPGAAILFLASSWLLGVERFTDLAYLSISSCFPLIYEWCRYRAMGSDQRWLVAQSDGIRLALTASALALPAIASNSVGLQTYLAVSTAIPAGFLVARLPRIQKWISYRHYSAAAGWQLLDFGVGQLITAVPLILLGGISASPLIGGVRLAQSLLGPLNLVFAAAMTNLVADGATRPELSTSGSLIARGIILGRFLACSSALGIVGLASLVYGTGFSLRGVSTVDLLTGVLLVGSAAIGAGWAGVHAIVLRLLNRQASVTLGRAVIAGATVSAFVGGYVVGGVDISLVLGFVIVGLASPAVFLTLARHYYRGLLVSAGSVNTGPHDGHVATLEIRND